MRRLLTVVLTLLLAGCAKHRDSVDVASQRAFLIYGGQKLEVDLRSVRDELKAAHWTPMPYSEANPYEFQLDDGRRLLIDFNATYKIVGEPGHFIIPAASGPNEFLYWTAIEAEVSSAVKKLKQPNQSTLQTPTSVTPAASAPVAPPSGAAGL